jgi:hypothetical protein
MRGTRAGLRISIGAALAAALAGCARRDEGAAPVTASLSTSSFVPSGMGCVWHDEFGGDQDGRLTIDHGTAAEMATRIDYVEISQ